jgi:hypothetical protein
MTPPSKRVAPSVARRTAAPRPAAAETSKPFLRFTHSAELRAKTLRVLEALERSSDPETHRSALAEIVVELTDAGMDSYFMKPLKLARAGLLTEQTARIGMAGGMQILGSVIRSVIGRMEGPQLLSVCQSVRRLML